MRKFRANDSVAPVDNNIPPDSKRFATYYEQWKQKIKVRHSCTFRQKQTQATVTIVGPIDSLNVYNNAPTGALLHTFHKCCIYRD